MSQILAEALPWRTSGLVGEPYVPASLAELDLGCLLSRTLSDISQESCEYLAGGPEKK